MRFITTLAFVLVAVMGGQHAFAASLRCGDYLVMPGDSTTEVISRCGDPLSREVVAIASSGVERESPAGGDATLSLQTEKVELWVYDPGPGALLRILHFRGGDLVSIENGDRSQFSPPRSPRALVEPGDTKAEVLQAWGEPLAVEELGARSVEVREALPDGDTEKLTATTEKLERWVYEFGPGEFRRNVIFKAGRVLRVELGERP